MSEFEVFRRHLRLDRPMLIAAIVASGVGALSVRGDERTETVTAKRPQLRRELLERMNVDQKPRQADVAFLVEHSATGFVDEHKLSAEQIAELKTISDRMDKVDSENTRWLKGVVEKYGWPTVSLVGNDGAHAAWLLVQHADADLKFQRNCLDLMVRHAKDEVSQTDVAYLTDRVLLAERRKQRYGTQFAPVNGQLQPRPLEDEANVDKRRAEVGLQPLAEYAKAIRQVYGGNAGK